MNFYKSHNDKGAALPVDLAAAWSKLEAYCPRFALLIHLIRSATDDPTLADVDAIDAQSIACAAQLVRWFGDEAMRVYGVMRESDEQKRVRELIELVQSRGGSITVDQLRRARHRYKSASDARDELLALAGLGFGELRNVSAGSRGGRPSEVFTLADAYLPETLATALAMPDSASVSGVSGVSDSGDDEAADVEGRESA